MIYALDTNTVSYAIRGEGGVRRRLRAIRPNDIGIPAVSVYEMQLGALRRNLGPARIRDISDFLRQYRILAFDEAAARHAAEIDSVLFGAGTPVSQLDSLIAGIARSRGLTLVTRNTREFSRVLGLMLEDWY